MDLHQVGIDPHVAPLSVRERLVVAAGDAPRVAHAVREASGATEALLISTCNRTEVYVASSAPDAAERVLHALLTALPDAPSPDEGGYVKRSGEAAARHAFRLAAGLESAILGETEIQGQLREAHRVCAQAGVAGPVLDRLVRGAIHAGKRVRTETALSSGGVSHGSAAAQVARRVFGRLDDREVLVVGAGAIATQAARAFHDLGGRRFFVANRTLAHAEELVSLLPGSATLPLDEVATRLMHAHVIVLAADLGGGGPTLDVPRMERVLARRRDPLLLLDLCVPRQADPAVGDLAGVFLYDLESLEALVSSALGARREAVPRAEAVLEEELARLREWMQGMGALPAIRSLNEWAEEVRRAELDQLPEDLPASARTAVEDVTRRLVQRLLGRAASRVVAGTRGGDPTLPTAEQLKSLFGLEERKQP